VSMRSAVSNFLKGFSEGSAGHEVVSVDDLDPFAQGYIQAPAANTLLDGDKFPGGFGITQLQQADYWTLRARSSQLFNDNLYARGLIRRLITNEINTGLTPELCPDEEILGLEEDSLADWTETVENRFAIWGKNPRVCDWKGESTLGALQQTARREALVEGDVLVVLRQSQVTKLPQVQLVRGGAVRTPLASESSLRKGHTVTHGVEKDSRGRVVAYWTDQEKGGSKRIPAFGEKSGRRIAWLVFGTDKRLDDVRGQPLLSIILQSLKEVDRYRDSIQRKAVLNSILAMFVKKTEDKMGTLPMTGGAKRVDKAQATDSDGKTRKFDIANQIPGIVMQELQTGEEPVAFGNQGTDEKFGDFEAALMSAIAWANEMPPEILQLAFSNNYSASQAAINEFKIYLNKFWGEWGDTFCAPIQVEWLLSEVLTQRIEAPGLLEAWRDPQQYDKFGAWTAADWYGSIKPSTDMAKAIKGSKGLIEEGLTTRAREARQLTGTKFSKNIKRLTRENQLAAEAARPLLELQKEFGEQTASKAINALEEVGDSIVAAVEEVMENE